MTFVIAALRQGITPPRKCGILIEMAKQTGNPNWGKPHLSFESTGPSEFEVMVKKLKLTPEQYVTSIELREWASKYRNSRFVPERLLKAWRLDEWPLDD